MSSIHDQFVREVPIEEISDVTMRIVRRLNKTLDISSDPSAPPSIRDSMTFTTLWWLTQAVGIHKSGKFEHRLTTEEDKTTRRVKRFLITEWLPAEQVAKEKEAAAAVPGYDANGSPV